MFQCYLQFLIRSQLVLTSNKIIIFMTIYDQSHEGQNNLCLSIDSI